VNESPKPLKRAIATRARALRHDATGAENQLWQVLRNRQVDGLKFRRQVPIDQYFADFRCREHKLIVELDGSQHTEQEMYDTARTAHLQAKGYRVFRFWNDDVLKNIEGVVDIIREVAREGLRSK
jgi:very-short-patch-repair endonuclease